MRPGVSEHPRGAGRAGQRGEDLHSGGGPPCGERAAHAGAPVLAASLHPTSNRSTPFVYSSKRQITAKAASSQSIYSQWALKRRLLPGRQVREVRRFEKLFVIETRFVGERELPHLTKVRRCLPVPRWVIVTNLLL